LYWNSFPLFCFINKLSIPSFIYQTLTSKKPSESLILSIAGQVWPMFLPISHSIEIQFPVWNFISIFVHKITHVHVAYWYISTGSKLICIHRAGYLKLNVSNMGAVRVTPRILFLCFCPPFVPESVVLLIYTSSPQLWYVQVLINLP